MCRHDDARLLAALEAEAERAALRREAEAEERVEATTRGRREREEAREALRPVFRAAVESAAPVLDTFLASPEWTRLRLAVGRLRGTSAPAELALPPLYVKGSLRRRPTRLRAVFEDEAWSVSALHGGVWGWTVGPRLSLSGKTGFYMAPTRTLFASESGLMPLVEWFEKPTATDAAVAVALRFCEIVNEGCLLRRLAPARR